MSFSGVIWKFFFCSYERVPETAFHCLDTQILLSSGAYTKVQSKHDIRCVLTEAPGWLIDPKEKFLLDTKSSILLII